MFVKKYFILIIICLLMVPKAVLAVDDKFNFDSKMLTFSTNSKKSTVSNSFNKKYNLSYTLSSDDNQLEEKIRNLAKKTTYLLLGDMNGKEESSEEYYKRYKDYFDLAAYKYFSKDKSTKSGYDEKVANYRYVIASELAIPQLFNAFNEAEVIYNSYGDIRVTISDQLVISSVVLPNVKIKEKSKKDPMKYEYVDTNLVIYYYFIKIDNEYRLCYLYGQTTDNINKYFNQVEASEDKKALAITTSYNSEATSIYNFDKLNKMSDEEFNNIYNSNINNIVYLKAYYNNVVTGMANGFFINDGVVVTTWDFLEDALVNAQYITVSSNNSLYEIEGIVTANIDFDVVVLKLKNKSNTQVKLASNKISVEDPAITISSKSGVGATIQKGIIVAVDDYIQTSIPLTDNDSGSPLFSKDGEVIGLNTAKSVNTDISLAVKVDALKEIQDKFNNIEFNSIETISFNKLKEDYYYVKYNEESIKNSIPKNKWKVYSKIGNISENIKLKLVKANYKDRIVSLRYKNEASKYISSMQLSGEFREQLIKDGYREVLDSSSKCIYENSKYQIIIMEEFDYLIVVMVMK